MKFSKKILIVASLFMAVGLSGSLLYWDSHFFTVKKVSVTILTADGEKINKKSSLEDNAITSTQKVLSQYSKKNMWRLDLDKISNEILANQRILSAHVQRDLPFRLSAVIEVREVAILFQDKKGNVFPVTFDGIQLEEVAIENAPDAPLLRDATVIKDSEKLKKIITLIAQLPENGTVSRTTVSEIKWTDGEGLKIELMHSDAGLIVLGEKEIQLRAKRAASVIKYLESQKQKWRVIDASFSKKVLVRLRKHS